MGIYYAEDIEKVEEAENGGDPTILDSEDQVPESMKDEKRLIVYVLDTGMNLNANSVFDI